MKSIGLTGTIGSGKSTIARVFEQLGVPVFYADTQAKSLYRQVDVQDWVVQTYGTHLRLADGGIDFKALAQLVFTNPDLLHQLNQYIHPRVRALFRDWTLQNCHSPYVIQESAILHESGLFRDFDAVIAVSAPQNTRIKRVLLRDNMSRYEVLERMNNQWSDQEKCKHADFVIHNGGDQLVIPQVLKIHEVLVAPVLD